MRSRASAALLSTHGLQVTARVQAAELRPPGEVREDGIDVAACPGRHPRLRMAPLLAARYRRFAAEEAACDVCRPVHSIASG
jgi:hypothetical protein